MSLPIPEARPVGVRAVTGERQGRLMLGISGGA